MYIYIINLFYSRRRLLLPPLPLLLLLLSCRTHFSQHNLKHSVCCRWYFIILVLLLLSFSFRLLCIHLMVDCCLRSQYSCELHMSLWLHCTSSALVFANQYILLSRMHFFACMFSVDFVRFFRSVRARRNALNSMYSCKTKVECIYRWRTRELKIVKYTKHSRSRQHNYINWMPILLQITPKFVVHNHFTFLAHHWL